jgi:HSP20 family protein
MYPGGDMTDSGDYQKRSRTGVYPQSPLGALQRSVNNLFDEFVSELPLDKVAAFAERFSSFSPRVDVWEGPAEFLVTVELPGVSQSDVEITLTKDELLIRGDKKRPYDGLVAEPGRQLAAERAFGPFKRRVSLDAEVQQDQVKATFKDGVLVLRMPKVAPENTGATKITINSEEI